MDKLQYRTYMKEYMREYRRTWVQTPEQWEKAKARKRRYYHKHKERLKNKKKYKYEYKYGDSNREYMRKYMRDYHKTEKGRLHVQKRHALVRGGGSLTVRDIQQVYEDNIKRYGTLTCYLCLKPIQFKQDSLDHKVPLSKGGTNDFYNLAVAHRMCNSRKGTKLYVESRTLNVM